jgi:hypothetical protein
MADLAYVAPRAVATLHAAADELERVADPGARVPGLEWTASDLGRHTLAGARSYEGMMRGDVTVWADLADGASENERLMRELVPEQSLADVAPALRTAADSLATTWSSMSGGEEVPWHGGLRLPARVTVTFFWGDVLLHGWDLARLTKRPWTIARDDAGTVLDAVLPVAGAFVDRDAARGFDATYEIRLRGGATYELAFAPDATLTVTQRDGPGRVAADCRLWADPTTFLLASYGRVSPWRAGVTGGIVAYGRKPWLAFRFDRLLRNP